MMRPLLVVAGLLAAGAAFAGCAKKRAETPAPLFGIEGRVEKQGAPLAGAWVVAENLDRPLRVAITTGPDGVYRLEVPLPGSYRVTAAAPGLAPATHDSVSIEGLTRLALTLEAPDDSARVYPSSVWLASLPAGEYKRRYILDCTGCHQLNETRVFAGGSLRTAEHWKTDAERMLRFAGANSAFPVISADCDPGALAKWLTANLEAEPAPEAIAGYAHRRGDGTAAPPSLPARVTEYDLPEPKDLPHDLAITTDGDVLATGMFTHRLYKIDPDSGVVDTLAIPVEGANPRAIEIDAKGNWWVLLGAPRRIALFAPDSARWSSWEIGMYPHSIAPNQAGSAVWFNGHFTRDPELIGRLDLATGIVDTFGVPPHPTLAKKAGGPVPYEARLAGDGRLWISELQGNRILGFDPRTRIWETHDLPTPWSGPRRFDVGVDGVLWIPEYAANQLVRFDPKTKKFEEIPLPIPDSVPYIARVDRRTGAVWIGTAAADVLYRYDPSKKRFDIFPVPTRGATMRHLAIDPKTGAVWIAYGASPAIHPARIARLTPLDSSPGP